MLQQRGSPVVWFTPYYRPEDSSSLSKVVDTTGAGNAFLGGFAKGFAETGDYQKCATVP